jgi:hypothetical protein
VQQLTARQLRRQQQSSKEKHKGQRCTSQAMWQCHVVDFHSLEASAGYC